MNETKSKSWWVIYTSVSLVLILIFFALGKWQLDRAGELKASVKPAVDLPVQELNSLIKVKVYPTSNLLQRRVKVNGEYVANFFQKRFDGSRVEVGLLKSPEGAILVLRGVGQPAMLNESVVVEGRLNPIEVNDSAELLSDPASLTRLDPALILNQTQGADIFLGYLNAYQEIPANQNTYLISAKAPIAKKSVPGYYWQHLAYTGIWWLMILSVIYLWIRTLRQERGI